MPPDPLSTTFAALADPDAARHPGAARAGRDLGVGTGRALRHEPSGRLQASEGAGARGPDRARPRGAVAALPDRAAGAQGRRRLARALSPALGTSASIASTIICASCRPRRVRQAKQREEEAWPQEIASTSSRTRGHHRHARFRRAARAGVRGVDRSRSIWRNGGARTASPPRPRVRHAAGRRLALCHARARRPRLSEPHHLRRDREAGAASSTTTAAATTSSRCSSAPPSRSRTSAATDRLTLHARVPVGRRARPRGQGYGADKGAGADPGASRRLLGHHRPAVTIAFNEVA